MTHRTHVAGPRTPAPSSPGHLRLLTGVAASALCLSLAACGSTTTATASKAPASTPAATGRAASAPATGSAAPSASAPAVTPAAAGEATSVPGYLPGEAPPVPMFTLPDLGLLSSGQGAFTPALTSRITSVPGVTVAPARCDAAGVITSEDATTVLDGQGGAAASDGQSSATNDGQGAGVVNNGEVTIVNNGDGSGSYSSPTTAIVANGDGSGNYSDEDLSVVVGGDGSGNWSQASTGTTIVNNGDGSGSYSRGGVSIVNNGDGSGTYSDSTITISNDGQGQAVISPANGSSQVVSAEPLAKLPKVGGFPSMDAVQPVQACGVVISLDNAILFDFDSAELRPETTELLSNLAQVLNQAGASQAQINGHTDSVSDDAYNQTLSEQRAQAVLDALRNDGAEATLTATGYGETQPVAPNQNPDGSDNPSGRQLNRRVEVVIPTS